MNIPNETNQQRIGPQPGPQEMFLETSADIAIYGGAAGGGKSFALLLEPIRHTKNKDFGGVIFRSQSLQIMSEGGLFDTSMKIYGVLGAHPRSHPSVEWTFPSGSTISMNHISRDLDVLNWQGSQIPYIGFDELTHFSRNQFFYMLSRNRSTCGVRPYVRATCNPDADSWVAEFISWWIDQDTGFAIPERSGIVRWFVKLDERIEWGSTRQELQHKFAGSYPKSFTFVPSKLSDNKILMRADPGYLANLSSMNRVDRERLLYGNWKVKPQKGSYFPSSNVSIISAVPTDVKSWIRRWDLAASEPSEARPSPDSTASVLMGKRENGRIVIANGINVKSSAHIVRAMLKNVASQDKELYKRVTTIVPQDPGQAGKEQASSLVAHLAGYKVKIVRETGPKATRAEPFAAQWQAGNVDIVAGDWNHNFIREMESFPSSDHDDYVDASSGAYLETVSTVASYEAWRALGS